MENISTRVSHTFLCRIKMSLGLLLVLIAVPLTGQNQTRSVEVNLIQTTINIDGLLDEPVWETAESASDFWQFFPTDTARAEYPTQVKFLYDDNYLYVGIKAASASDEYVVSTLERDFSGSSNANVTMMFDTYSNGSNAYMFGVTPYGVQRDVLISGGGSGGESMNTAWDARWQTESTMYEDHFIVEVAIPFSSLRFREGSRRWRFQVYRWNLQSNEQSAWSPVPQNQLLINLAFMGDLIFEKPLGKSRIPVAVIPYINTLADRDFLAESSVETIDAGGDIKIAIGQGMNLDLTINSDFSNAEVDDIITNLTRFEISRPERRQFFLENSDLFASFGSGRDDVPFFSRRIGIARDSTGRYIENRILAGARLSGNLNQNWRLGFLNIQTDENRVHGIPSNNNMMFALQRRVFARSTIGAFFINRETFQDYDFLRDENKYNRVMGVDYNLASADNVWTGTFYLHKSLQPNDQQGNYSAQTILRYNTRNYQITSDFVYVDQDYRSDLGFVPRKDVFKSGKAYTRRFWPDAGVINSHSVRLLALHFWRPTLNYKLTDHDYQLTWEAEFLDQSGFEIEYSNKYIFLVNGFDPTRSENGVPLPGNTGYTFNELTAQYQTGNTDLLTFALESTIGEFFNGNRFSFGGELNYRVQPWGVFGVSLNYDQIRLPDPHGDADFWILSPDIDISFSKSVFWSFVMQYSNQQDNLGINSRLQWRFAPLSDLYLVYNDNYYVDGFSPRYRSINLKLTYWLNI